MINKGQNQLSLRSPSSKLIPHLRFGLRPTLEMRAKGLHSDARMSKPIGFQPVVAHFLSNINNVRTIVNREHLRVVVPPNLHFLNILKRIRLNKYDHGNPAQNRWGM